MSTTVCASFIVANPCPCIVRDGGHSRTMRRPRTRTTTSPLTGANLLTRRRCIVATLDAPGKPPTRATLVDDHDGDRENQLELPTNSSSSASSEDRNTNGTKPSETGEDSQQTTNADTSANVEMNILGQSFEVPARWLLYAVPFMWGSFGVAVRYLFSHEPHIDPPVFNTTRLFLSSLVYMPILAGEIGTFLSRRGKQPEEPQDENEYAYILGGIELGFYVFLANVAQVLGLESVAAGRAAFLVQCQTVIVPVLSGIFGIEVIRRKTWISSLVAIAGVAMLSFDHAAGAASSLRGDALELVSAFFFSTYILRLGAYASRVRSAPLVATKIVVQALLSAGWVLGISLMSEPSAPAAVPANIESIDPTLILTLPKPEWTLPLILLNAGVVVWTGMISSALAGWAQTKGQKLIPASETVVIFATQPLWASGLAVLLLGESFGPKGIAGGALIVASTLLATAGDNPKKDS